LVAVAHFSGGRLPWVLRVARAGGWFEGGKLNVSYNCLDRHLNTRGDQVAIIWEGDNPNEDRKITYRELHEEVCKLANVHEARGVQKGDRVCIYMPMIPEAACRDAGLHAHRRRALHRLRRLLARFAARSHQRLRMQAAHHLRRERARRPHVPLKKNADKASKSAPASTPAS
jgi:acetyl-CoA synthetase